MICIFLKLTLQLWECFKINFGSIKSDEYELSKDLLNLESRYTYRYIYYSRFI